MTLADALRRWRLEPDARRLYAIAQVACREETVTTSNERNPAMTNEAEPISYEGPAIIELMGRHVIAGRVSTQLIAGVAMLRVDVPPVGDSAGYTKFFSGQALYAVTPTDEATMQIAAQRFRVRPVDEWTLPGVHQGPKALPAPMTQGGEYDRYDDDDYEDDAPDGF